jgi:hyperosmotically inducible protein
MRVHSLVPAAIVGTVLFVGAAAPSRVAAAEPGALSPAAAAAADDDAVRSRISDDLKHDALLAPRSIDVEVKQGAVVLTGKVRNAKEKSTAGKLAKVQGVTRVTNRLEIDPKIDQSTLDTAAQKSKAGVSTAVDATTNAADKAKESAKKGVGKSEEGVSKAADKTADAVSKAGEKLRDAAITTKVKTDLSAERALKDSAIDVQTTGGVVTLRGSVGSEAQKDRAGVIARGADGVSRVDNQLVIRN